MPMSDLGQALGPRDGRGRSSLATGSNTSIGSFRYRPVRRSGERYPLFPEMRYLDPHPFIGGAMAAHPHHRAARMPQQMKWATTAVVTVAACLALMTHDASPQTQRTIKIVVPFAPGGGVDIVARLMGDQISRMQKVTVVVENRPGAGTLIGTEAVARSTPDGNTILFAANSFI